MTKRIKIIVSVALCIAMVLSMSACSQDSGTKSGTPQDTTNAEFQQVVDAVQNLTDKVDSDVTVEKKIQWMAWWAIDETTAEVELFKQVYGIPEEGDESYGSYADCVFVYNYVNYNDRYTQLGKLVASGDSPDIFPFESSNYPYSVVANLFQPIDNVVDLSDPLWDDTREAMDQFVWGGRYYCAIPYLGLNYLLWYRNSVVQQAGIDDPYELYREGNWNWNTFLDMCDKFQKSGEGKYAIDGWGAPDGFIYTTGQALITLEDGKLTNNLYNADIERCMSQVIDVLYKQNYRYPRHELNGWNVNENAFVTGDTLFFTGLGTDYKDVFRKYFKRYNWEENDLWCVPFPKDPQAEKYYHLMKNDAHMFVAGSDNAAGFKAWVMCQRAVVGDEAVTEASHEQMKENYDYTDEILDWLDELQYGGVLTPVFDFKTGLGQDFDSGLNEDPITSITYIPYMNGLDADGNPATFASQREANNGAINDRIAQLNASLEKNTSSDS